MLKKLAALTVAVLLPLSPLSSAAQNPAPGPGYVIAYINGLSTDPIGAQDGVDALNAVYSAQYNNQSVSYTLFYTPTDGLMQDVINAFAQRVRSSPGLTDRWELIWDTLDGGGGAISDLAIAENPSLSSLVSDLKTTFLNDVLSNVKNVNTNKEFQPAVDQFASTLTTYYTQQKKTLVVAHSQGNVYLNAAYDAVKPQLKTDSLRTVAVATPAATVRDPQGRYVTSTTDLVIQAVALALGNVEPANTDGPILAALSSDTGYGHKFVDIYMNPNYKLLSAVKALADSNLQALQSPPS
ncbi:MAG TPA: hypothetical protein VNX17_11410 [Edaphobacter sp.]|nr:hypothetical protein [Edaphobacter sp.]